MVTVFSFWDILGIYVVTLLGNIFIPLQSSLFFLFNFSLPEIWYTNSIVPGMLKTLLSGSEVISFAGYMAQFYFFSSIVVVKCFLLAAMSYDHYLVICRPLWYPFFMNLHTCILLSGGSWLGGFLNLWSLSQ